VIKGSLVGAQGPTTALHGESSKIENIAAKYKLHCCAWAKNKLEADKLLTYNFIFY